MSQATHAPSHGALAGLSVVELGDGTAAPFAAKMLGDFGGDVIKVEGPGGDSTRRRGPFPDGKVDPEASGLFLYLNINKLGVMLDLEREDARRAMQRLLAEADVFITNRPVEQLRAAGLAPDVLRRRFPRLVIATLSPFGSNGPWADRHGDELVTYAMGGLAYSTPGMPDASADLYDEPPLHPTCFAAETIAGLSCATAIMVAVNGRELTQQGCHIDISQQAAVAAMQIRDVMNSSYGSTRYNRLLNPITIGRMPNFYLPCQDGYVTVAAPMDIHWQRLVEAMGEPAWAKSADYASSAARTANWIALRDKLIEWTMTLTGDALHVLAEKYQLPIFPFYSIRKMAESEHARARRTLVEVKLGERKGRMPAAPVGMRATPWAMRYPAPRLGEHSDLVLGERLGVSA
jgi:crotonobetainyl-CoA:carnitine CoA-transferase CaiB-like acyl-CoA transferase